MSGPLLGFRGVKTAGLLVIGCEPWAYFPSFSTVVQRIPQIIKRAEILSRGLRCIKKQTKVGFAMRFHMNKTEEGPWKVQKLKHKK
jgi:hypothetical protein